MATLLRHGTSRVSSASSSWRGPWTGTSFKSFSRSLFVEATTEEQVSLRHLSGAEEGKALQRETGKHGQFVHRLLQRT
jgi:hypothetical protein